MGKPIIFTSGDVFGRLTVIEKDVDRSGHDVFWKCQCTCGKLTSVRGNHLKNGKTISCGCFRREKTAKEHFTHGHSGESIHNVWMEIGNRCRNKNATVYKDYGGRGIDVCDEWFNSFESFYDWSIKNGYQKGLTIDRINNNDGYKPDNCRWITQREQCWNRRNSYLIEYMGEIKAMAQWCYELNMDYHKTYTRIHKLHWPVEKAFNV